MRQRHVAHLRSELSEGIERHIALLAYPRIERFREVLARPPDDDPVQVPLAHAR